MGWVKLGRRKLTPGRPMTFVVTQGFLDHFGLESDRDLPGIAELRAAGLLDNRPAPGAALETGGEPGEPADDLFEASPGD
jgi:segregation and condensation protein B